MCYNNDARMTCKSQRREVRTMRLIINGRQMTVYETTKEMAEKKLAKFEKFFDENAEMTVSFSHRRDLEMVEITVRTGGILLRAEEGSESFAISVDRAVDALLRQIRKNKTRLAKRIRSDGLRMVTEEPSDVDEEPEFRIRTKTFSVKPMSVEEAIMQMNLLSHDFFVFSDAQTHRTSVVYKRKDGDYGLILPTED